MARMKWWEYPWFVVKAVGVLCLSFVQALTVGFYEKLQFNRDYYFDAKKRKQIKRELAMEKVVGILDEKVKRLERLLYSVFEDPEYAKSNRGKHDLKELGKNVK